MIDYHDSFYKYPNPNPNRNRSLLNPLSPLSN